MKDVDLRVGFLGAALVLFVIGISAPYGQPFTIAGGMALIAAAISDHGRNQTRYRDTQPDIANHSDANGPR